MLSTIVKISYIELDATMPQHFNIRFCFSGLIPIYIFIYLFQFGGKKQLQAKLMGNFQIGILVLVTSIYQSQEGLWNQIHQQVVEELLKNTPV